MYNFLSNVFKVMSASHINKSNQSIYQLEEQFVTTSEEKLKELCRKAFLGENNLETTKKDISLKEAFFHFLSRVIGFFSPRSALDEQTVHQIALAVEVFRRAPADLPAGSRLFPQQVSAAVALTQTCLVQMDTGEGKTYAILPAAFSLACHYGKVYIVCANKHLAFRDARRTRAYWEYIGLAVGLCTTSDKHNADWDCPIVYTTLDALLFTHLRNETGGYLPKHPIKFGAVILDEADAILLDNGTGVYSLEQNLRSESYDWTFATTFAKTLKKEEDIIEYYDDLSAVLTLKGEELLREAIRQQKGSTENYLVFRKAVECAYAGLFLARENVHYIVDKTRLHPIDLITGEIAYGQERNWLLPIEHTQGFPPRVEKVSLHSQTIGNFFRMFSHLSGTSGSIVDDLTEYFFSYLLFTIIIPPRKPRHKGEKQDRIFRTKKEARKALLITAIDALKKGQPVLIGVQNINDAEYLFGIFRQLKEVQEHCRHLRIVTGKDDGYIAELFEQAGQEYTITIATQVAGRGVDIRLSAEARKNGGLALLCLEHSLSRRHDRQFLGRAGRQGDPFSATFFVSLEDELMLKAGSDMIKKMMEKFGYQEDEEIAHPMVTKSIHRVHNRIRNHDFLLRRGRSMVEMAEKEVQASFQKWVDQSMGVMINGKYQVNSYFIQWTIEKYITENIEVLVPDKKEASWQDCQPIVQKIKEDLDIDIDSQEIEGRNKENVLMRLNALLARFIEEAIKEGEHKQAEAKEWFDEKDKYYRFVKDELEWTGNIYYQVDKIMQQLATTATQQAENDAAVEVEEQPGSEPFETVPSLDDLLPGETLFNTVPAEEPVSIADGTEENSEGETDGDNEAETDDEDTRQANLSVVEHFLHINNSLKSGFENELTALQSKLQEKIPLAYADYATFKTVIAHIHDEVVDIKDDAYQVARTAFIDWDMRSDRSPVMIVYWSIFKNWIEYLQENKRDKLRLEHVTKGNNIDYNRMVCDELIKDWERVESVLPAYTLRNLSKAGEPRQLDPLFFYDDNGVDPEVDHDRKEMDRQHRLIWEKEKGMQNSRLLLSSENHSTSSWVSQFLQTFDGDLTWKGYTLKDMQHTLNRFVNLCPISRLRSPDKIQEAIQTFKEDEIAAGIEKRRREENRKWVMLFLKYLNTQKVIASLPNFTVKFKSQLQRLKKNVSDPKTVLAMAQPILFLIIFVLLSIFATWLQPKQLSGWQLYINYLFFGGLITTGAITASSFFLTSVEKISQSRMISLILIVVSVAVLGWWQIAWTPYISFYRTFLHILTLLAMLYVAYRTLSMENVTRLTSGISLLSGWYCYCILFIFFPRVFGWQSIELAVLLAVSLGYYYWRSRVNYGELTLLASLTRSIATLRSEGVRSCLKVEGSVGFLPHLYAAAGTLLLAIVLQTGRIKEYLHLAGPATLGIVLLGTYALLLFFMVRATIKTRLSVTLWKNELNRKHVLLVDTNQMDKQEELDLAKQLNSHYKVFLWREVAFQALVLAGCYWLFRQPLPNTMIPAFAFMPFIIFLFAEHLHDLAHQLFKMLISRSPVSFEQIDFSSTKYEEEHTYFWDKIGSLRFAKKIFGYLVATLLIIKTIIEAITNYKDIREFFKGLF